VEEDVAGGSDLSLTVQWNSADELVNFDRSNCFISHYTTDWDIIGAGAASGSDPYSISRSGITSLSPFAVVMEALLPIELYRFVAYANDHKSELEWTTLSEINSDYFEIQHSFDAIDYKNIGSVKAAGNSLQKRDYSFIHENPAPGTNYYRLKMNDLDGSFEYSNTRLVEFENNGGIKDIRIFPNPTQGPVNLELAADKNYEIELWTLTGQLVSLYKNVSFIDLSAFDTASYILKIKEHESGKLRQEKIVLIK
jgi:hypothetical protein